MFSSSQIFLQSLLQHCGGFTAIPSEMFTGRFQRAGVKSDNQHTLLSQDSCSKHTMELVEPSELFDSMFAQLDSALFDQEHRTPFMHEVFAGALFTRTCSGEGDRFRCFLDIALTLTATQLSADGVPPPRPYMACPSPPVV